ncbi:DUF302 domain-containing protein [Aquabacterium humicola]|uniref:DUF302 domain-containing protein n=1 Tax=Aquabacterium humicola TaxID=3237377 RepID=UPI002542DBE6|nr:DUF302 domain-containing protein [Rubrivivax pictus]
MHHRILPVLGAAALGLALTTAAAPAAAEAVVLQGDGIVRVRSAYGVDETVSRLKADVAAKGIRFFSAIDQAQLAADAGIALRPSTLIQFGNPPLGAQFLTANANAGLDWPVRVLVTQDADGTVWATYTDFGWIARRHGITNRMPQFEMASRVVESITSTVRK